MKTLDAAYCKSPLGRILLLAEGDALVALEFTDRVNRLPEVRAQLVRAVGDFAERETRDPAGAATRLERYFAGDLAALGEQPVNLHGTAFQCRVWQALRAIPAGETRGYGELATAIGAPNASRAVGAANGSNPVAIIVPCHRVIAADGSLHGYGGGLERKRWLLAHEGAPVRAVRAATQLALA
jgi:methylated-DNA-[protein]-cysteine S-methyltransferase